MNDEEIIASKIGRYMAEAGGATRGAMRLMAIDLHRIGDMVSLGFCRAPPVASSGLCPKAQVEAIDIPSAESPVAANPGS